MGDVSIIARRMSDRKVQYGWSGNGGYFEMVGSRLLRWYDDPEMVEYLFGLGQISLIGKPYSENGGVSILFTNTPINRPHWEGTSERNIFSKIAFVDYGYFYDLDHTWYYVMPGPFRIKIPLHYIAKHLVDDVDETDELDRIEYQLITCLFDSYYGSDEQFQKMICERYPQGVEAIRDDVLSAERGDTPCHKLFEKYRDIHRYFDDWVVVKTTADNNDMIGFSLRKRMEESRAETIEW